MPDLINMMRQFVQEQDQCVDAACDLWTWLPSYAAAETVFGDYADEQRPKPADLMKEAALVFAVIRGGSLSKDTALEWLHLGHERRLEYTPLMTTETALAQIVLFFETKFGVTPNFS